MASRIAWRGATGHRSQWRDGEPHATSGAKAIFLETETNPQLADQIASETGIRMVTGLYTHSITSADGKAPTYIDMVKADTMMIVEALR